MIRNFSMSRNLIVIQTVILLCLLLGAAHQAGAQETDSTSQPVTVTTPRNVISHDLPNTSPSYDTLGNYGSNQPLLITGSVGVDPAAYYTQAKNAGIDILAVDCFVDPTVMIQRLTIGDQIGLGFEPCIDTALEGGKPTAQVIQDVVNFCTVYVSEASTHTSAVKVNGKYQISTYNDSAHLNAGGWAIIAQTLAANSVPVTFLGDINGNYLGYGADAGRQALLSGFAANYDQLYTFGPSTSADATASLLEGLVGSGKPFAGTVRSCYLSVGGNAASGNAIGYEDAQGTQTLQSRLQDASTKSMLGYPQQDRTLFVSTWSDFSENSEIMPSTDWNCTQSDILAWYASQYKGLPLPFTDVRQYITVQQSGYLNGTIRVEVLVLNGSSARVYVKPVVQNLNAQNLSSQFGGPVAPYAATSFTLTLPVTTTLLSQTAISGVNALKVWSPMTNDLTNVPIGDMESARVVLFPTAAPAGGGQALYYSLPNTRFCGYSQPHASLNISSAGVKTLNIFPAGGYTAQSLELLHDTRRAYISYGAGGVSNAVFTDLNRQADNRNDPTDHGCYLVREVTIDGRETYSDPIYVTHY